MPNGMNAINAINGPLRAVPYPPVLPLMHPALRGLCKPNQSLAIGLTGTPSLLNRYRPTLVANYGANLNLNQQRRAVVNRHLKDDGDASDAGIMELYHR